MEQGARAALRRAKRVVIKVGSSTLARDPEAHRRLARGVRGLLDDGRLVLLVSSGAIALGARKLGYRGRPKEIAKLQAAASAGQSLLMRAYEEAFDAEKTPVAQVLLTHSDLGERVRANNARAALSALLEAGAVPVLNENDAVAVEEIKFGDNDALSAMVTPLVGADALVLLSDVDGLLDRAGVRVGAVEDMAEARLLVRASKSEAGTGGMDSKLEAARRATLAGAHVVIANASRPDVITRIFAGEDEGTVFVASARRIPAKKHWIAFTLRPRGDVVLDPGAATAVQKKGTSVLTVGVAGVRGDFRAGDSVRLVAPDGSEIGRGLVRAGVTDAALLAGKKDPAALAEGVLVHRDDLVVW